MRHILLFECFAGIGAQTKAFKNVLKKQNLENEINLINVGTSEWYIDAIIAYSKINHFDEFYKELENSNLSKIEILKEFENFVFSKDSKKIVDLNRLNEELLKELYVANKINKNFGSITTINGKDLPKNIDIFTYSFPCQSISLQGKQIGLNQDSKSTSSLVWEIIRILKEAKDNDNLPKILLMENVKALFSNKFIDDWNQIKYILSDLGYNTFDTTINSSDKGSIQRRERVFSVSILKSFNDKPFSFNDLKVKENNLKIKDILIENVPERFFCNKLKKHITTNFTLKKSGLNSLVLHNYTTFQSENILYSIDSKAPTITASGANSRIKIYDESDNIRFLTPLEIWLLMGFEKDDFDKNNNLSNHTLLRLAGNSISIEVLEDIFEDILNYI